MTAERFTLDEYYNIEDNYEQKIYHGGEDTDSILDLLNKLNDENEQLKQQISDLRKEDYGNMDGIAFYQEENASLRERIVDLEELNRIYVDFLVEKGYELSDVMKYE